MATTGPKNGKIPKGPKDDDEDAKIPEDPKDATKENAGNPKKPNLGI